MLLGSSQGGVNIEEVARDTPEAIITVPVNIFDGIQNSEAQRVAEFMGFAGEQQVQVLTRHHRLSLYARRDDDTFN